MARRISIESSGTLTGGRLRIHDPRGFGCAVKSLVTTYHNGLTTKAAVQTGITRQSLDRWIRWSRGEFTSSTQYQITQETAGHLARHFSALGRKYRKRERETSERKENRLLVVLLRQDLEKACEAPRSTAARDRYNRWVLRRLTQFDAIASLARPPKFDGAALEHHEAAERYEIAIDARTEGALRQFRAELKAFGHERNRIELAIRRIIEPILDARLAGGIERLLGSYSSRRGRFARDLAAFVQQGIRRERFVLDRQSYDRLDVSLETWSMSDDLTPDAYDPRIDD